MPKTKVFLTMDATKMQGLEDEVNKHGDEMDRSAAFNVYNNMKDSVRLSPVCFDEPIESIEKTAADFFAEAKNGAEKNESINRELNDVEMMSLSINGAYIFNQKAFADEKNGVVYTVADWDEKTSAISQPSGSNVKALTVYDVEMQKNAINCLDAARSGKDYQNELAALRESATVKELYDRINFKRETYVIKYEHEGEMKDRIMQWYNNEMNDENYDDGLSLHERLHLCGSFSDYECPVSVTIDTSHKNVKDITGMGKEELNLRTNPTIDGYSVANDVFSANCETGKGRDFLDINYSRDIDDGNKPFITDKNGNDYARLTLSKDQLMKVKNYDDDKHAPDTWHDTELLSEDVKRHNAMVDAMKARSNYLEMGENDKAAKLDYAFKLSSAARYRQSDVEVIVRYEDKPENIVKDEDGNIEGRRISVYPTTWNIDKDTIKKGVQELPLGAKQGDTLSKNGRDRTQFVSEETFQKIQEASGNNTFNAISTTDCDTAYMPIKVNISDIKYESNGLNKNGRKTFSETRDISSIEPSNLEPLNSGRLNDQIEKSSIIQDEARSMYRQIKEMQADKQTTASAQAEQKAQTEQKNPKPFEAANKDVELIAKFDDKHVVKDKETGEVKGKYAIDIQPANHNIDTKDLQQGMGNLPLGSKQGESLWQNGRNHSQYLDKDTFEKIKEAGKDNAYTDKDGNTYIPFKADISEMKYKVDHTFEAPDGSTKKVYSHRCNIDPDSIQPSELGKLDAKSVSQQIEKTEALRDIAKDEHAQLKAFGKVKVVDTARFDRAIQDAKARETVEKSTKSAENSAEMA